MSHEHPKFATWDSYSHVARDCKTGEVNEAATKILRRMHCVGGEYKEPKPMAPAMMVGSKKRRK